MNSEGFIKVRWKHGESYSALHNTAKRCMGEIRCLELPHGWHAYIRGVDAKTNSFPTREAAQRWVEEQLGFVGEKEVLATKEHESTRKIEQKVAEEAEQSPETEDLAQRRKGAKAELKEGGGA